MKNRLVMFYALQPLMGGGEIEEFLWGKLAAAIKNRPWESKERALVKDRPVCRTGFSLMQWGVEAGEMAGMTGLRVDGGKERAASPER